MTSGVLAYVVFAILIGFAGINRKGGFLKAFLISLFLSPIVAIILVIGGGEKNPRGCNQCGNKLNEAEFCGLCHRNEFGELEGEAINRKNDDIILEA